MTRLYPTLALAAALLHGCAAPPASPAPASAASSARPDAATSLDPGSPDPSAPPTASAAASASTSPPAGASSGDAPAASGASLAVPPAPTEPAVEVTVKLKHAPFGEHPQAWLYAPASLREHQDVPIVVFLHGWYGCLQVLVGPEAAPCQPGGLTRSAMDLRAQFAASGVSALFVVPQLPFDKASSAPGGLAQRGELRALLNEVLARPELRPVLADGARRGHVVLIGHSGAYLALGRALAQGGVDVQEVWLLDALYLDVPELRPWFASHRTDFWPGRRRRLAFVYTEGEKTGPRTLRQIDALAALLPAPDRSQAVWRGEATTVASDEALAHPLVAQQTSGRHSEIPRFALAALLRTATLR